MKRRGGKAWLIGLMAVLAVGALAMSAEALSFDLNFVFSGSTPAGAAPWATALFTTTNTTPGNQQVTLTFTGKLGNSGQFISELDMNASTALNLSLLSGTMSSCLTCTTQPVTVHTTQDIKADGDGLYDVGINFATAGGGPLPSPSRFDDSDVATVVFTYTGAGTFNDLSFNVLSSQSNPAGPAGPFHIAAHVQGIPGTPTCSGWVSDTSGGASADTTGPCTPVPEPMTMFLGGTGLLALGYVARKRLFGVGGGRLAV